jgi:hypothetical protein
MTTIVLLNVVFAVLVVAGIVSLLGWAIVEDRVRVATLSSRANDRLRSRTTRPARREFAPRPERRPGLSA